MGKASAFIKIFGYIMIILLVINMIRNQFGLGNAKFEYFLNSINAIETDFIESIRELVEYAKSIEISLRPEDFFISLVRLYKKIAVWIYIPFAFGIGLSKYIFDVLFQVLLLIGFDFVGNGGI